MDQATVDTVVLRFQACVDSVKRSMPSNTFDGDEATTCAHCAGVLLGALSRYQRSEKLTTDALRSLLDNVLSNARIAYDRIVGSMDHLPQASRNEAMITITRIAKELIIEHFSER